MRISKTDQTGWMSRLILVFAWRTCHFVGFVDSCTPSVITSVNKRETSTKNISGIHPGRLRYQPIETNPLPALKTNIEQTTVILILQEWDVLVCKEALATKVTVQIQYTYKGYESTVQNGVSSSCVSFVMCLRCTKTHEKDRGTQNSLLVFV